MTQDMHKTYITDYNGAEGVNKLTFIIGSGSSYFNCGLCAVRKSVLQKESKEVSQSPLACMQAIADAAESVGGGDFTAPLRAAGSVHEDTQYFNRALTVQSSFKSKS